MKQMNLYAGLLSILLSASLLTGCDKEESLFGDRDVTSGMYELNVTSAEFTPAEGQSSENAGAINIPFGNDDAMGLVMVDGDKVTHTRYIYKELLGKWSGDLVVKNPSAKIFAYYPYDEKLETSSLNTDGTNALDVFGNMILNFEPQTDQSKEENFRKSNLMVGTASLDEVGKKISINMESVMALAVVKVDPNQNGIMSLESDPDYAWEVEGISTESLAPFCKYGDNTFVCYVMPEKEQTVSTSSGRVIVSSIGKSMYQECTLSLIHTLQPGDFFMKDGSLIGKDATLTDAQKADCIGIVFQTDENRIGDAEKETLAAKGVKPHGLVMALKNVNNNTPLQFSVGNVDVAGITNTGTLQECYDDIDGLAHTNAIYSIDPNETLYPIFTVVKNFNIERPVDRTTEWFLPSIGQFWDILINLGDAPTKDTTTGYENKGDGYHYWKINSNKVFDNINTILNQTDSDKFGLGSSTYDELWVAGEPTVDSWKYARKILFNNTDLHMNTANKSEKSYKARPILAF